MSAKETLTGAEALIRSLELENVEVMFGLPGGCILPAYDPLLKSSIRHVLVRHEQGAGHMAQGYAHVTGRPGVAMVTSGPAATNMVTPLCDAFMDSIPMVCITGQVSTTAIGTDAFQGIGWLIWAVVLLKDSTSPAKKMMGLVIVDVNTGAPATMTQMVLREIVGKWVLGSVTGVVTLASFVMLFVTPNRQAVWDYIGTTSVVRRP